MSEKDLRPLDGTTVIEVAAHGESEVTLRAVALAGRIAADLGARVVRVVPEDGDPLAAAGTAAERFLNGGKCLVTGDASAREACAEAVAVLQAANTRAIAGLAGVPVCVAVAHGVPSRFGMRDADVSDASILALSGLLDIIGDPAEAPVPLGGHQASYVAGLAAFSGLAAALASRARGAERESVTVSALEACLWSNWKSFAERLYLGRTPTRQGSLSEWQAIPCRDGFATLIYLERDWPAVCKLIGDSRLSSPPLDTQAGRRANMAAVYDVVRPWYRERTRAEIFERAKALGLPIAPVLTLGEVLADRQYAAQAFFAAPADGADRARVPTVPTVWNGRRFAPRASARTDTPAPRPAASRQNDTRPLAGCRVLDLGIITAGASTSAVLADLGADVVKVESSAYIDPFRVWDRGLGVSDWWNRSRFFDFTNRNKRGLALDLKHPEGRALFLDLVAKADVLVENFRRGVLERLGLGWDVLSARNPRLVLCSVTSQGETGPDAGAASYGSTLEATSGLSDLTRNAAGDPVISGILLNYPDQIVSIYAAGVVTLAVEEQRRTGRGARLDISQRELASFLIGEHLLAASLGDTSPLCGTPRFVAAADGRYLLLAGPDTVAAEAAARALAADAADRDSLIAALASRGHPALPVRDAAEMQAAFEAGETRTAYAMTPDGSHAKGAPFALREHPITVSCRAPWLGQHNEEVLADVLGLGTDRIARLAADGIIGKTPKV